MGKSTLTLEERFFAKVIEAPSGCWEWQGAKVRGGYGIFCSPEKNVAAHRWLYRQMVCEIPAHLECDHLCRNRACVNPWHIELVTHRENIRRSTAEHFKAKHDHAKGLCRNGHDLRTHGKPHKGGYLECARCKADRNARRRLR